MAIKKKSKSIPKKKPNKLVIVTILSLAVNAIALVVLITGAFFEKAGTFNYAIVNDGIATMCSTQFRNTVENNDKKIGDSDNTVKLDLASIDYQCSKNGGGQYFIKGFNEYAASLGLKPAS